MKTTAVILGAGKGVRMKCAEPKQYLPLQRMPILSHSVKAFDACADVHAIILVVPPQDLSLCQENIIAPLGLTKPIQCVGGGHRRQESVKNALDVIQDREGIVAIHDGVRPFITPRQISECIAGAAETGACILAVPVSDTLKSVDGGSQRIAGTIKRSGLWLAQTPQAFRFDVLMKAHEFAQKDGFWGTDDAALVERMGVPVFVRPGSRRNIKITQPEDLELAQAILNLSRDE